MHNGEPAIAVVADPFENTLTFAERGAGAYISALAPGAEARRIHVATGRTRKERYAEVDGLFNTRSSGPKATFLQRLAEHVQNVHMGGSHIRSWALLAQGRIDVSLTDCIGGYWDTAPGIVIVTEAGGKVTDMDGNIPQPGKYHVALGTNGELHDELLPLLQVCYRDYEGFR